MCPQMLKARRCRARSCVWVALGARSSGGTAVLVCRGLWAVCSQLHGYPLISGRLGEAAESGKAGPWTTRIHQGGGKLRAETSPSKLPALSCSPSKGTIVLTHLGLRLISVGPFTRTGFEHSVSSPSSRRKGQLRTRFYFSSRCLVCFPGIISTG